MYLSIQRHYGEEPEQMEEAFPKLAHLFKEEPTRLGPCGLSALVEIAALSNQQDLSFAADTAASCAIAYYPRAARAVLAQNLAWSASPHIDPQDRAESLLLSRYIVERGIGFDYRVARNALCATEIEPSVASQTPWAGPQFKPSMKDPVATEIGARAFYLAYIEAAAALATVDHDLKPAALRGLSVVEAVCRGKAPNIPQARARILQA